MRLHADGGSTETLWSYSRIVVVAVVVAAAATAVMLGVVSRLGPLLPLH